MAKGTKTSMENFSGKHSEFVNLYMSAMFLPEQLYGRSVSGKPNKKKLAKPKIDQNKLMLLEGKFYLQ
jgi:hypothetical protein